MGVGVSPPRHRAASSLWIRTAMPRSDGDALSQGGHDRRPAQGVVEPVPQRGGHGRLAVDDVGRHRGRSASQPGENVVGVGVRRERVCLGYLCPDVPTPPRNVSAGRIP
jgi:hypothetical protein